MKSGYYRSGQAARVWAISPHLVRRLCEARLIEAERTSSGQWKIPHSEVERIRTEGVPEIPSSIVTDDGEGKPQVDSSWEHNSVTSNSDELETFEDEPVPANEVTRKPTIEYHNEGTSLPDLRKTDAEALTRQREMSIDSYSHVETKQDRITWHDSWMARALGSLPCEAPQEIRLAIRETVSAVLGNLGPEHSWMVIEPLVNAAVAKALRPWNQERETARAIETVCSSLPYGAKNPFSPTIWQSRAYEAARVAIRKLPPDSTFLDKLRVSSTAIREVTCHFEDDELRNRIVQGAYLYDIAPEEHENAKEAIRKKLESLRPGTSALALQNVREQVLASFREAKKRTERVDLALQHVRPYLESLHQGGETNFGSYSELWNFSKHLEGRLRPIVERELLDDYFTDDELSELVEELVDEELD